MSDVTEGLDATAAIEESRDLDDSLDPTFSDKGELGHHTGAYKKVISKYVYEMVRMDREVGTYIWWNPTRRTGRKRYIGPRISQSIHSTIT